MQSGPLFEREGGCLYIEEMSGYITESMAINGNNQPYGKIFTDKRPISQVI
jgi:hypothetical protein